MHVCFTCKSVLSHLASWRGWGRSRVSDDQLILETNTAGYIIILEESKQIRQ